MNAMKIPPNHESSLMQMRAGVEALSEGFALFDESDLLEYCNTAFVALYPDLANILKPGLPWSMFLIEAKRKHGSAELERLDAHLSSGITAPMTLEACNRGSRWLRMSIRLADGGGFVLTGNDITDEHQAHEIIENADDLLRDILDACASRIVLYRLSDGKILYRTPAWLDTFGDSQNIQSTFAEPVSYADLLADLLPTSRIDDREDTMLYGDGNLFPTRVSARRIDYQSESSIIMSVEDITQLHAQREEIIQTNQRLLDAIEALDQGFVLFDADHRLLMANQHYMDVNACIHDLLIPGTANSRIVEQSRLSSHEPLAAGWPQSPGESVTAKYEFQLDDKRSFSVSRRATSDGGFVIAWRDVTEQRATEKELANRRDAAFQNEKLNALGQLLAGVAHELNNPLSVVLGHAMMLKDEVSDADALEGIETISRSAERCAKIVKTFLAMARQKPTQVEQCSLNDTIAMAWEIASYGMRKSGIDIDLRLGSDLPAVSIDEDQVTQVFINLMINAEQALSNTSDSPMVRISTFYEPDDNQVVAVVSDNGPGVTEANRLRIFEPFYTTKPVGEGTGVGLALSHRIISSHEGQLALADGEIGGATFVVTLPVASSRQISSAENTPNTDNADIRALLVEDESDVRIMMQKLISSFGVTVVQASDAEQGLTILQKDNQFDLILCDLRMPGMGGLAMLREIDSRWPVLAERFVFVTGDAISEDVIAIREAATHQLIEKPVSPDELRLLIHSVKRRSQTRLGQEVAT